MEFMKQAGIEEIRNKIMPILKTYGIRRVGIFGSAARGEMGVESDIDVLVDLTKDISLIEFVAIKQRLEDELKRKVDLVEYDVLKPALRKKILEEQVVLQ
ncbi:MAG: nucleotidyltransferase family protein [Candidatus Liptonbacteria bacterium]|nr:nucleotidyltransferase family protein [Candidatus Liptonbacteria bacterium]